MMTIKIFIASSAELNQERKELVDLMQDLIDETGGQAIKFKTKLWEFMDSSMGEKHKEEEYLEKLRECDICIVLFWLTLGEYTVKELDVAISEMHAGKLPKLVYVLFKEPYDGISDELMRFKESFSQRYPHVPVQTFNNKKMLRELVAIFISTKL